MGSIISSKVRGDGKIIFEVCVNEDEALQLKGNINNIHLFSDNTCKSDTKVSYRGTKESTVYFLIPKELRDGINLKGKSTCHRIDTDSKTIFIFKIEKYGL